MDVDDLVNATAALNLGAHCCDSCCRPTFFFLSNDPPEEVLSWSAKRKFYVVNKGAVGSEGIYTHQDVARTKVEGISDTVHESSKTANGATPPPQPLDGRAPPPYEPIPGAARQSQSRLHAPTQPHGSASSMRPAPSATQPTLSSPLFAPRPPSTPCRLTQSPSTLHTPSQHAMGASPTSFISKRNHIWRGTAHTLADREDAEAELRAGLGTTLLVSSSLEAVEGDDEVTLVGGGPMFYRVFGSPRVAMNRDSALAELVATGAGGLLVGSSLAAVDDSYNWETAGLSNIFAGKLCLRRIGGKDLVGEINLHILRGGQRRWRGRAPWAEESAGKFFDKLSARSLMGSGTTSRRSGLFVWHESGDAYGDEREKLYLAHRSGKGDTGAPLSIPWGRSLHDHGVPAPQLRHVSAGLMPTPSREVASSLAVTQSLAGPWSSSSEEGVTQPPPGKPLVASQSPGE
ncbi:hypothetical protein B0H14DRAFT_2596339 [Mycena olivaceomarginata]|nr:hypothetical protein B0H14DRAFT_2596339 [Mycena olivaceomarginata]